MRIAVWHNLPSGGGKRALFDHVAGLVSRGHTVESWCPPTADQTHLPLSAIVREHVVPLDWSLRATLPEKFGITRRTARLVRAMDAHCQACALEIAQGGFDVLYANCCMFFRTTAIGRFTSIPSALYLGEPYRWLYEAMPRLRWLAPPARSKWMLHPDALSTMIIDWRETQDARLQAREEVDNAAYFDRILVNSYFSRESVLRAYGLDSQVCYLGIDIERFRDQGVKRSPVLLGLGAMTPEKNPILCIEAVATLPSPRPKLVWVGNTAYPDHLAQMKDLAARRQVDLDVRIGVTDAELLNLLNTAAALLYAPRLEPFGLAPLEANACGLPVIAVAEGGVRETMLDGTTGFLVDNTPEAMGQAIRRLLADPDLAARIGTRGRINVEERWTMEGGIDRIEKHLAACAAGSDGPLSVHDGPARPAAMAS